MNSSNSPINKQKVGNLIWFFWIDRGSTFTDVIAQSSAGALVVHRLLSENLKLYAAAALQGIRDVLNIPSTAPIPAERIAEVRMHDRGNKYTIGAQR